MKESITLRYHGPLVADGRLDAYETAANIVAFCDYLGVVAKAAYGVNASLKSDVKAFSKGSFSIEFLLDMGGIVANLLSGPASPKDLFELIADSFSAWKHLRGDDPAGITQSGDNHVNITNGSGQVITVNIGALSVISSESAAKSAARFISKALYEEGIDSVSLSSGVTEIATADQSESGYFGLIATGETIYESTSTMALYIESPTFKDGNKWRFADGQTSFSAAIKDRAFLDRVASGDERFGKGDILVVEILTEQKATLGKFKTERTILTVRDHRIQNEQRDWIS